MPEALDAACVPAKQEDSATRHLPDGPLCATTVLLGILALRPFTEVGLIDDFSYVKTTWIFARNGHFVYNGWATAMLGWQVVWGALFVRLLGASFFATRLSTLVLAILSLWLFHAILTRSGLPRAHAVFGTLLLGFSSIFAPLAVTFMTDISGLFVILLCLYACLRTFQAASNRAALLWLVVAAAAGIVGGTARQIAWLTVLVMVPATAWHLRKRRSLLATGALCWMAAALCIAVALRWFQHQPFSVPEPLLPGSLDRHTPRELLGHMLAAALCLIFLLTPLLASGLGRLRELKLPALTAVLGAASIATPVCSLITSHLAEKGYLPWTGDVIDKLDLFDAPNAWMLGVAPVSVSHGSRVFASVAVLFVLGSFVLVLLKRRHVKSALNAGHTYRLSWRSLCVLLLPFSIAYVLLLIPRGVWAEVLDRYLLPLQAIAVLVLLRVHRERIAERLPGIAWAVLAAFSIWTLAGTHDWIASHKARLLAVARLESAGIPRTRISAGYEFDGLTQIDRAGAIIDPRVTYPNGFNTRPYLPEHLPAACASLFNPHTPQVRAEYFLAYGAEPCLTPSGFGVVGYTGWLPPFHREIQMLHLATR